MQCHQGHSISGRVLAVGVAGQGSRSEETLEITFIILFLILQTRIDQLLQIAPAFLRFIGALGDQLAHIAALLHHLLDQLRRRGVV